MNYLVHLYLSGDDPELQLGGMLGDFVKGPIPDTYPAKIRHGLRLHRKIDTFAQANRYCRSSRLRLHPRYGHVRSIMVDIFYDHFLALDWAAFHSEPLETYADRFYRTLETYHKWLPDTLARIAPRMTTHNWLVAYREKSVVERALHHLASQLSRPTPLAEGLEELDRHEVALKTDFIGFMAEAKTFADRVLEGRKC